MRKWRKALELPRPPSGHRPTSVPEELKQLSTPTATSKEIADKLHVTVGHVRYLRCKLGLPRPRRGWTAFGLYTQPPKPLEWSSDLQVDGITYKESEKQVRLKELARLLTEEELAAVRRLMGVGTGPGSRREELRWIWPRWRALTPKREELILEYVELVKELRENPESFISIVSVKALPRK